MNFFPNWYLKWAYFYLIFMVGISCWWFYHSHFCLCFKVLRIMMKHLVPHMISIRFSILVFSRAPKPSLFQSLWFQSSSLPRIVASLSAKFVAFLCAILAPWRKYIQDFCHVFFITSSSYFLTYHSSFHLSFFSGT